MRSAGRGLRSSPGSRCCATIGQMTNERGTMAKGDRLTDKQRAFVSYYLGEARMNATKAAAMAGYRVPRQEGARLLANAVIQAEIEATLAELRAEGIANKANRIRDYDELRRRIWLVIEARAAEYAPTGEEPDPAIAGFYRKGTSPRVVGGESGLVVKQFKVVGSGRNQQVIEEHVVDSALISELLAVNKQAAQELGEWSEKRQITGADGGPIEVRHAESAAERLLALLAQADEPGEASGDRA